MAAQYPGLGTWTHTLALYDVGFEVLETHRQPEGAGMSWPALVRMRQFHTQFEAMQHALARAPARTNNWC